MIRLEIPASAVGLEGKSVTGIAFTLYGGQASWDHAGKNAGINNCSLSGSTLTVTAPVTAAANIYANGYGGSTNIAYGGPVTITWDYTNATSCTLDPAIDTISVFPSGSGTFATTLTEDENYTISCLPGLLPGQPVSDTVFVDVAAQPKALNIIKSGQGTATSTPAGINCGTDCTEDYLPGTTITLHEMPAKGRIFTGWSGISCNGGNQKASSCTFDLPAGGATVTVNFMVDPNWKEF